MTWCERFKQAVDDGDIELFKPDKEWKFLAYNKDITIKFCPFCGAKLIMEDI